MTSADPAAPAPDAGGFRRFALLCGLRMRLVLRGPGKSVGARLLFGFLMFQVVLFAAFAAYRVHDLALDRPELRANLVRGVFMIVFALQLMLGVMSVAVGDFYDVGRLVHLPFRPREIFAAMSVSALFTPTSLFALAPIAGVLAADGRGPVDVILRLLVFLAGLWCAHLAALAAGYGVLRIFSKRRLRDLATIVGSVLGIGVWIAYRAFMDRTVEPGGTADPLASLRDPLWETARVFPGQWFAEAFVGLGPGGDAARGALWLLAACALLPCVFALGSAAFRGTYDAAGESAARGERVVAANFGLARFLPPDAAAVANTTMALFKREPQLRALLLSQLVFLAFPVVFGAKGGEGGAGAEFASGATTFLVPFMVTLSHSAIALSMFGLDGRGLYALFASPMSRKRILQGRLAAVLGVFLALDLFASGAIVVALRLFRHAGFEGALGQALGLFLTCAAGDCVQVAVGAVASSLAPLPVVRARRGASARLGREGCVVLIARVLVLLPIAALVAIVVLVAMGPGLLGLGVAWYAVSALAAAGMIAFFLWLGVRIGAEQLANREETVLQRLVDAGD